MTPPRHTLKLKTINAVRRYLTEAKSVYAQLEFGSEIFWVKIRKVDARMLIKALEPDVETTPDMYGFSNGILARYYTQRKILFLG